MSEIILQLVPPVRFEPPSNPSHGSFDPDTHIRPIPLTGDLSSVRGAIAGCFKEMFVLKTAPHRSLAQFLCWAVDLSVHPATIYLDTRFNKPLQGARISDEISNKIILYGIARGIGHLHRLNCFHGNLRPDNIYLDSDNHPYIVNMSCPTFHRGDASSLYRRSKFCRGNNSPASCDAYSFGVLCYKILTGQSFPAPGVVNISRWL
jgi:hypothetical protein